MPSLGMATSHVRCANPMIIASYKRTIRLLLLCLSWTAGNAVAADANAAPDDKAFIGRWDLTIKDSSHKQLPSWLELTADQGAWKARFVGRWGHARFLPTVAITGDA